MPSSGASGGILVAWDSGSLSGQTVAVHEYHVTVRFSSTSTNNSFLLSTVYAPCLNSERTRFFEAMSSLNVQDSLQWIVLGDFNMYRFAHEKSQGLISWNVMERFNSWIKDSGLDDIHIDNRLFTWSNKMSSPTLVRLEHVLVNTAWNLSLLHTSISVVPATTSDHAPILVKFSDDVPRSSLFRMENHWLETEEARNIIMDCW
ncbi:hypothetical protein VPH35_099847 [Triticum aestivum]|uniref:Endonuclease/exonuclease/phosphatase domain-containing protein n=1 Tax=Aegilops tauschii subsp. strangulata TaxID=200361 RepID=A0A453LSL3_AEGTS